VPGPTYDILKKFIAAEFEKLRVKHVWEYLLMIDELN
jgi:hypothetical protein